MFTLITSAPTLTHTTKILNTEYLVVKNLGNWVSPTQTIMYTKIQLLDILCFRFLWQQISFCAQVSVHHFNVSSTYVFLNIF